MIAGLCWVDEINDTLENEHLLASESRALRLAEEYFAQIAYPPRGTDPVLTADLIPTTIAEVCPGFEDIREQSTAHLTLLVAILSSAFNFERAGRDGKALNTKSMFVGGVGSSFTQVNQVRAHAWATRLAPLLACLQLPIMVHEKTQKAGQYRKVAVAASMHIWGASRAMAYGEGAMPGTKTTKVIATTKGMHDLRNPDTLATTWLYALQLDKCQADWMATFHHSPSTAPTATTLQGWGLRLVGAWSCGEASPAANALISVVCLLFADVFDDFPSLLPEKRAFNNFNKQMHRWSRRLTFGLLGYGLLMVTDRKWCVPHNEEAALDARHLTVNFRLPHALKPLAINTGHRLMREETKIAVPVDKAGQPKTPTSAPTPPKHQLKPGAPTTTAKGAKVLAGVVAAGELVDVDNKKGSDKARHIHLVCKQPAAGVVGSVAVQVRVAQIRVAANTIWLPCKAKRGMVSPVASTQLQGIVLLALESNNWIRCIAMEPIDTDTWAFIRPFTSFPLTSLTALKKGPLPEPLGNLARQALAVFMR